MMSLFNRLAFYRNLIFARGVISIFIGLFCSPPIAAQIDPEIWQQVDQVNRELENISTKQMPGQLKHVFGQALRLTQAYQLLDTQFVQLIVEARNTGNWDQYTEYRKKAQPAFELEFFDDELFDVRVNISHFSKLSLPQSEDQIFFALADSGYYMRRGDSLILSTFFPAWQHDRRSDVNDVGEKQYLLKLWQQALPGFTGIYREVAVNTIEALSEPGSVFEIDEALWATIDSLNQNLASKSSSLMVLFQDALALSQDPDLDDQLDQLEIEADTSGNRQQLDQFIKRAQPALLIEKTHQFWIFPNVPYFLSLSGPDSVAFRFFDLINSGYCFLEKDQLYWKGYLPDWIDGETGQEKPEVKKQILERWQALRPDLTGIYQTVADSTISCLTREFHLNADVWPKKKP